jgi:hypothetical protein
MQVFWLFTSSNMCFFEHLRSRRKPCHVLSCFEMKSFDLVAANATKCGFFVAIFCRKLSISTLLFFALMLFQHVNSHVNSHVLFTQCTRLHIFASIKCFRSNRFVTCFFSDRDILSHAFQNRKLCIYTRRINVNNMNSPSQRNPLSTPCAHILEVVMPLHFASPSSVQIHVGTPDATVDKEDPGRDEVPPRVRTNAGRMFS